MSEQQWRLRIGRGRPPMRETTFWSPSQHAARNLAAVEANGRPFILEPICPHCDRVIEAGSPLGDDGRYCHPACMHAAVRP